MLKIRTEKKSHEVKIYRGEDSSTFIVEPMTPRETDKLLKKFTKHEKVKGQIVPETDFVGFMVAKVRRVIVDWDVEDENGNQLECNDANKEAAYMYNPALINDVIEEADKIAAGEDEKREAEEKN